MARVVVLGATGHIGAHVVRALLAGGHEVRAAYRTERFLSVLDGVPVERVRVDLDTGDGLRQALDGCEWVFHAAGYYPAFHDRRDLVIERGMASTRRVLQVIREAKPRRVVFTSSAATIRRVPGRPATEQDLEPWSPHLAGAAEGSSSAPHLVRGSQEGQTGPSGYSQVGGWRPLYATVKIAMEHEVRRAAAEGLPVVIVNPSVCVGEHDARPFSGRAVLVFARGRLPCYLEHTFNAVYTGDVAIGHVRAAERGVIGERYLLACRNLTIHEFAILVAEAAGVAPPRIRLPYRLVLAAAWASEAVAWLTRTEPLLARQVVSTTRTGQWLDGGKAQRELALPQTPIEEAIRRALVWFRQHGYL